MLKNNVREHGRSVRSPGYWSECDWLRFILQVSVCPYNIITGFTLFIEDEERSANAILTRSDMEAYMVVHLAGRCAEKLVMGESEVTGMGAPDLFHANMIAR